MEFEPKLYLRFIISISISYLMGLYSLCYFNIFILFIFIYYLYLRFTRSNYYLLLFFHRRIPHIFTYKIYIYNIYLCQEKIYYYLDISIPKT
jgi:hypothetical protein